MFGGSQAAPSGAQLLPQSLLEGGVALALVLLLAVPLIMRIHKLLEDSPSERSECGGSRRSSRWSKFSADQQDELMRNRDFLAESSSGSSLRDRDESIHKRRTSEQHSRNAEESFRHQRKRNSADHQKLLSGRYPSMLNPTYHPGGKFDQISVDSEHFDYNVYRHKLMEEVLKKYFDDRQPPGHVVMNSIHLNAADDDFIESKGENFFAFVEDRADLMVTPRTNESASQHPLDHFLVRGSRHEPTDEKGVTTNSRSLTSVGDAGPTTRLIPPVKEADLGSGTAVGPKGPHRSRIQTPISLAQHYATARGDTEERPKTAGSKLPCVVRPAKNKAQQSSKPRPKPPTQKSPSTHPPEILCIERDDSPDARPGTGASSSDNYEAELSREARRAAHEQELSTTKQADVKRPWMCSLRPKSFNRKYNLNKQDAFEKRWRSRSRPKSRPTSPNVSRAATASPVTQVFQASDGAHRQVGRVPSDTSMRSREPSPAESIGRGRQNLDQHEQQNSELLQVTMLSSSLDQAEQRIMGPSRALKGPMQPQDSSSADCSVTPKRSRFGGEILPGNENSGLTRRRSSRLPVQVNSKKPMGINGQLRDEIGSASPSTVSIRNLKSSLQRPKTSYAVMPSARFRMASQEESEDRDDVKSELQSSSNARLKVRPKTADDIESRDPSIPGTPDDLTEADSCEQDAMRRFNGMSGKGTASPLDIIVKTNLKNERKKSVEMEVGDDPVEESNNAMVPRQKGIQPTLKRVSDDSHKNYAVKLDVALSQGRRSFSNIEESDLISLGLTHQIRNDLIQGNLSSHQIMSLREILQFAGKKMIANSTKMDSRTAPR
ncbi:hypothetical protein QAD02_004122 [Eretmocerus hayati]|uniref:Uncharacterized protein n=1 Tax=Eretmocerus hayati TaxID=131215 RepID=A0ACC2NP32_9HYME|nr:hypothetical protein QAD02_004122 [Eretmocerus hayati]